MSLQTYDFSVQANRSTKVSAQGRYIYYRIGTTPLIATGNNPQAAGNQEIKATAGSTSVLLLPGQCYRIPENEPAPGEWTLTNARNAETITGVVFIGEGDFNDNNTSNTNYLKLDATFANNVKVTNGPTERVPVTLDPNESLKVSAPAGVTINNTTAQRVPVTLDAAAITALKGNVMAYNASYAASGGSSANVPIQMLSAAANVNGAILNRFDLLAGTGHNLSGMTVVAKATTPANLADGEVLFSAGAPVNNKISLDAEKDGQVLVPAGKAVWYIANGNDLAVARSALFTLLPAP